MKRLLLACALAMLTLPAAAATFSINLDCPNCTPPIASHNPITITPASAARILAWATASYPTIPNPAYDSTKPVDPTTNPQTLPNPDPLGSAFAATFAGITANVRSYEKAKAVVTVPDPAPVN